VLASPPVWPLYLLLAGWFSMRALPLLSMAPCPVGELMRSCVGACQGNDASNEFFLALAKENSSVAAGEYYRCVQALTFLPYLSHTLLSRSAHLTTPTAPEGSQEEMLLRITHLTTPTAPEGSQNEVQAPEVACRAGRSPTRAQAADGDHAARGPAAPGPQLRGAGVGGPRGGGRAGLRRLCHGAGPPISHGSVALTNSAARQCLPVH